MAMILRGAGCQPGTALCADRGAHSDSQVGSVLRVKERWMMGFHRGDSDLFAMTFLVERLTMYLHMHFAPSAVGTGIGMGWMDGGLKQRTRRAGSDWRSVGSLGPPETQFLSPGIPHFWFHTDGIRMKGRDPRECHAREAPAAEAAWVGMGMKNTCRWWVRFCSGMGRDDKNSDGETCRDMS